MNPSKQILTYNHLRLVSTSSFLERKRNGENKNEIIVKIRLSKVSRFRGEWLTGPLYMIQQHGRLSREIRDLLDESRHGSSRRLREAENTEIH